jgi:hypothetical protein
MNDGGQSMIIMTTINIFNNHGIEPADAAATIAVISTPFLFVFFYGLFTESVAIWDSRKKNYIIIMGFLQVACLVTCSIIPIEDYTRVGKEEDDVIKVLISLLTVNSFAMAVNDTIIDGLMVI